MAGQEKWYFTRDQLINSPSRKCGLDADKELAYRQQAANLIQDMGQRLQVSQLCINTAIVYMHRFYAFHSFTQFHRNAMAAAALFLAAKMEEQPRKLEHVIKVAHICLHRGDSTQALDVRSDHYQEQAQDLVFNENVLLQTLGFDVAIDHPHTHVVKTCSLIRGKEGSSGKFLGEVRSGGSLTNGPGQEASKDLAQTSYFMASNSLHLTTMCLQYRPTVVACFCIHLASKWSNWEIPQSNEGKHWFNYVDRTVTAELLEHLTSEFLHIFDRCPSRLKKKIMSISNSQVALLQASTGSPQQSSSTVSSAPSPFDKEPRKIPPEELEKVDLDKRQQLLFCPSTSGGPSKVDFREYRERQANLRRTAPPPRHPSATAGPNLPPSAISLPTHNSSNSSGGSGSAIPANVSAPSSANPAAAGAAAAAGGAMAGSGSASGSRWAPSNGVRQPPRHPQPRHPPRHSQLPPPEQRPRPPQVAPPSIPPPSASLPPPAALAPPSAPVALPAAPPPVPPARPPSLFSPEQRKPSLRPQPLPPPLSPFHSPPTAPTAPPPPSYPLPASVALETDPTLVSSLLKEAIPHRSDKKKKKEKHKHRDRDKRDDRKKHKKSKDKRRESDAPSNSSSLQHPLLPNANISTPIKITIPREAIVNSNVAAVHNTSSNQSLQDSSAPTRLKIKIPKERLRTEPPVPPVLKIKIPKEVVEGARKRPLPPQQGDNPPPTKSRQGLSGIVMGNGQHHSYQK